MQPAGMSSIAALVELGDDQDAGVAKSSRAGTKRKVKARPTILPWPGLRGMLPRNHTLRKPFLINMVVSVAVVTFESTSITFGSNA